MTGRMGSQKSEVGSRKEDMQNYLLIPFLPLAAFLINILFGRNSLKEKAHWVSTLAVAWLLGCGGHDALRCAFREDPEPGSLHLDPLRVPSRYRSGFS